MDVDSLTIDEVIDIVSHSSDEQIQILLNREKNEQFLSYNNITTADAKDFIRSLNKSDLDKGPVPDDNPERKHPVWIFKKNGFGHRCYIKIKIINKGKVTIVISLHEDEYS